MARWILPRIPLLRIGVALLAGGVLAVLIVLSLRPLSRQGSQAPGIVPGLSEDLQTLVGTQAPSFSLPDDRGVARTVSPGQGKPLVLILHMGLF